MTTPLRTPPGLPLRPVVRVLAAVMCLAGLAGTARTARAEPLGELQGRLEGLRATPKVRLTVDVAMAHQGVAPLHWSGAAKRGRATVVLGKRGAHVRGERWLGTTARASAWGDGNPADGPLLSDEDAADLVDPAGTLLAMLDGAVLQRAEDAEWQGRPARLLVFAPGQAVEALTEVEARRGGGPPLPLFVNASVWLDEQGVPLAMERSLVLSLGHALEVTQHQTVTYQQVGGRLFVAESADEYQGSALFVLRGRDARRMWVTAVE